MKRSKPLARRAAPARRTRINQRSATNSYRKRERFTDYMLAVKKLPCAAINVPGHVCRGPIEADHAGARGTSQKAHDSTVIPLCQLAHGQRTDFAGPFRTWDQQQMRAFLAGAIAQTKLEMLARGITPPIEVPWQVRRRLAFAAIGEPQPAPTAHNPNQLTEDLREEGNLDVRNPDAAPPPPVHFEGDRP